MRGFDFAQQNLNWTQQSFAKRQMKFKWYPTVYILRKRVVTVNAGVSLICGLFMYTGIFFFGEGGVLALKKRIGMGFKLEFKWKVHYTFLLNQSKTSIGYLEI